MMAQGRIMRKRIAVSCEREKRKRNAAKQSEMQIAHVRALARKRNREREIEIAHVCALVHARTLAHAHTRTQHTCKHCEGKFGRKWMMRGTCWLCRHKVSCVSWSRLPRV